MMIMALIGFDNEYSEELYSKKLNDFERKTEEFFRSLLNKLNIHCTIKTDRKSLPYNGEIITVLRGSSFINDAFDLRRISQRVVKTLLDQKINQLRFYVEIEIKEGFMGFGEVHYKFRYHVKQ